MRRLASLLPIATLRQRANAEARELTERWDVPLLVTIPGTDKPVPVPPDLADRIGRFHRTRDGYRISGRLLLDDVRIGSESPVVPLLIAANAVLGGLAVLLALLPHLWPLAMVLGIAAVGVAVLARQGGQVGAHAGIAAVWSALLGAITTAMLIGENPAHTPGAAMVMGIVPAAATVALGLAVVIALFVSLGFLLDSGPPASDGKSPPPSPSAVATLAVSAATGLRAARAYVLQVVVVAALLLAGTWIGGITGWAIALLSLLPAAASGWAHSSALTWERARQLLGQSAFYCGEDFGPNPNSTTTAREKQALAAVQDETPWLPLGVASGHLSSNCSDFFAPDENMPFGLTIRDLATHLAVFGTTGTGKTSGVLRPLINAWIKNNAGGVLLLDGKASLPAEFRDRDDYKLLDPANPRLRVALFEGLAPEDVAAAVQSAVPREHGENAVFFTSSAAMLLTHALVLLRFFADDEIARSVPDEDRLYRWSPVGLSTLIAQLNRPEPPQDGKTRQISALTRPLLALCERVDASTRAILNDPETTAGMAGKFVLDWFDTQEERTRSNIHSTVKTWLDPLALHPLLLPWASAEHGVDPTEVLRGAAMGLLLPETTYGVAGRMTSALIRARLYKALRERGDLSAAQQRDPQQTRCLMVIDEAQEVLTEADRQIVAVSRSLGLTFVIATQSVDALHARFSGGGGNEATALLDNFSSLVALRSSPATYEYVRARVGKGWSKQVTSKTASPAWQADLAAIASTAAFDPHHPHAAHYATLRRRLPRGLDHANAYAIQPASVTWEQTDIVTAEDWTSRLAEPFVAIALLLRAGAPRRDYVILKPQFPALAAPQPAP